ncbi:PLP-dependent aminotransferase family protein [bacterium]|nr:PLP-dependent aminotransferase family protein [bacterium]
MPSCGWRYSRRALAMQSSIIRETLKIAKKPGVISFGGGLPAPELFPVDELLEACKKVLTERPDEALQYGTTEGYPPLRELIAERMNKLGVSCEADRILITGGSQQGLHVLGSAFLDEGDYVVTARPTYLGAIQAFNSYSPRYVTLDSDNNGMKVDGLREIIEGKKPKMIYLVPTFQNPDGRTIPKERRQVILELADKYQIPVIEDDPYSELYFEEVVPEHMISMSPNNVIMLGTFSKLLAPGLRVAWLIAPKEDCYDRCVRMKQGADLHTNTLAQHIIYEFMKTGALDRHVLKIREAYAKRRDVMVEAMKKYFPENISFTEPKGGLFLWVTLPEKINTAELISKAVEKLVAYIPGTAFYPNGGGENAMRLNFSKSNEEEIEIGIKRLSELFKEALSA